jgi:cytochrome b involved in lipid metabolism
MLHWQVAQHNTPHDCWVSFNGGVYDLTPLLKVIPGMQQLQHAAGSGRKQKQRYSMTWL